MIQKYVLIIDNILILRYINRLEMSVVLSDLSVKNKKSLNNSTLTDLVF
jgi:hypothetical protein